MSQSIRSDLKIIVIGCSGTGKTSFVQRWIKGEFEKTYKPTIITEFQYKVYECRGQTYRILLWDIGGQDKTPAMAKIFTRDSHGCIVVSDITKKESLEETMKWKKVVNDESAFIDGDKLPFIFIQNKVDLIKDDQEYLNQIINETKKIVEDNQFLGYYITSVKENVNVEEPIKFLIENIVDRLEKYYSEGNNNYTESKGRKTYTLEKNDNNKNNKKDGKCC
jgi:small GTP-binding protein